jgi:NADH:ubiquinone oxidoreductase subunit F (NADH-binding)
MSGKTIKLLNTKKALELTGYRSINSLLQLHESEDVALTCYKVSGGRGRGGVGQAWSEKELKEFMKNNHQLTEEKWLID